MNWTLQKTATLLVLIAVLGFIMIEAAIVLKPMAFSLLLASVFLWPVQKLEQKGVKSFWAVGLTMLTGSLLFVGFIYFLSVETVQAMSSIKTDMNVQSSEEIMSSIQQKLPGDYFQMDKTEATGTLRKWMGDFGIPFISNTFKSTGYILTNGLLAFIYTFLILLYRSGIKQVLVRVKFEKLEEKTETILRKIVHTGQQYVRGLALLVLSLTILYAITFWLFGVDYPLVFATVAASLAIIPYVGTTLGASLPVIYAYLTYDNSLIALGLAISIVVIQTLEGNILTPKIVGGSMKLNPLSALVAVVLGNFIWGLAGMIVFLPLAAMMRVVFDQSRGLRSLADLSGQKITKQA